MLILCDNTTERVALLVGQLCDNTEEKAALLCHMLWSQRPYEVVMSFTLSPTRAQLGRLAAIRTVPSILPYHLYRPSVRQPPEEELQ